MNRKRRSINWLITNNYVTIFIDKNQIGYANGSKMLGEWIEPFILIDILIDLFPKKLANPPIPIQAHQKGFIICIY
jgi:hypothetical protein